METRGLETLCKGNCEELKAAKQAIAELVEENRLLKAKLDRANEDLRLSQEAQMNQNLRHCCDLDQINLLFLIKTVNTVSQPFKVNSASKVTQHRYSKCKRTAM